MNDRPLVSVCIRTYQHASFIRQCLDSVLAQVTNFQFEIIIGEDDSTDGTRQICQSYRDMHPSLIKLHFGSDADKIYIDGVKTGRRNFINNLQLARGRYISLLDGDDFWIDKNKLQKQVDFLERNPDYNICFCRHMFLKNDRIKKVVYLLPKRRTYNIENLPVMSTSAVVFRNPGFEKVPAHFFKTPFLDFPLYMFVLGNGKARKINKIMVAYREHEGGIWGSLTREEKYRRNIRMYKILYDEYDGLARQLIVRKFRECMRGLLKLYNQKKLKREAESLLKDIENIELLIK